MSEEKEMPPRIIAHTEGAWPKGADPNLPNIFAFYPDGWQMEYLSLTEHTALLAQAVREIAALQSKLDAQVDLISCGGCAAMEVEVEKLKSKIGVALNALKSIVMGYDLIGAITRWSRQDMIAVAREALTAIERGGDGK